MVSLLHDDDLGTCSRHLFIQTSSRTRSAHFFMTRYADIAFPTAVRRCFTYRIPGSLTGDTPEGVDVRPGMRVWVPLKNQMAIGMVVRVHQEKPPFQTREIVRFLDDFPVLSNELLKLTDWIHRFYYSSRGEAIQAALPTGMNFVAEPILRLAAGGNDIPSRGLEREVYEFLAETGTDTDMPLSEISKKWHEKGLRAIDRLASRGMVEIWQIPKVRMQPQTETLWDWRDDIRKKLDANGMDRVFAELFPDYVPYVPPCFAKDHHVSKPADGISDTGDPVSKTAGSSPEPGSSTSGRNIPTGSGDTASGSPGSSTSRPARQTASTRKKNPKWIEGLCVLAGLPLPSTRKQILDQPVITPYVWNRIRESGLLRSREVPADQVRPSLPYEPDTISTLNTEQEQIFGPVRDAISNREFKRFLLYGITGSGKTEIYIHALRETLRQGRGGLILVPEIALTPQTVRRFHRIFGNQIAVLHSRLSERERYEAWTSLQKGEKKVAIGARSAVFAPVRDPGLIIIDEEHDPSYKQEDPAPRYHARETAIMRAWINKAVILTGSATPSLASLHASASDKCTMLRLDNRHALAQLPEVRILDLKQYRFAMRGPLAVPLYLATEEAIKRKEQVILLLNRRGFATFIQCEDCGGIVECPHCSVSLTYHKVKRNLRCHYCGHSRLMPKRCPSCDSEAVGELGMGTQKVESELADLFPDARIARMDQDTTSGKDAHDRILQRFARGDADILMGTQIVAKGLDFPNVTVVGVINSDTELAFPSYRSSERMYQLLSQVAGRSGRGSKPGLVFLQTLMPDHVALKYAQKHDFPGFARQEMKSRKKLHYPPYSRLVKIFFRSADAQRVAEVADIFTGILARMQPPERVMGPSPSTIARMKNTWSWESHLKLESDKGGIYIERLFDTAFAQYEKEKPRNAGSVRITINVDTMH
ncbi:MAG: primosomal protein N' [Cyclonatronaceae bacterium]